MYLVSFLRYRHIFGSALNTFWPDTTLMRIIFMRVLPNDIAQCLLSLLFSIIDYAPQSTVRTCMLPIQCECCTNAVCCLLICLICNNRIIYIPSIVIRQECLRTLDDYSALC